MSFYLKQEDGSFVFQENGFKIILQEGASPSPSSSISLSPSASISLSPSASPSASISLSPSASISPSASPSSSLSPSASPSAGYADYTREANGALPGTDADLDTVYTDEEEASVEIKDGTLVSQDGLLQHMIHQFKCFVGANTTCKIFWTGQTTLSPAISPVILEIYNQVTLAWVELDRDSTSQIETDFDISAVIKDLTDYQNSGKIISCRVRQLAV